MGFADTGAKSLKYTRSFLREKTYFKSILNNQSLGNYEKFEERNTSIGSEFRIEENQKKNRMVFLFLIIAVVAISAFIVWKVLV